MKLVFPNLGNLSTLLCACMRELGGSFVGPIPTSAHTAELGVKYAPPDACMPMKIVLGNLLEGYENGADTALFFGGTGPCCFGYFAETFRLIFAENNIPLRVIALEKSARGVSDAIRLFHAVSGKPGRGIFATVRKGAACAKTLDEFENRAYLKRAEIADRAERARLDRFLRETWETLARAPSLGALQAAAAEGTKLLDGFLSDSVPKLKIGIVGDIYSVIDPFMNREIQTVLSDMGIYAERNMSLSFWIEDKVKRKKQAWQPYADRFLREDTGGFARETVGCAARWLDGDFDGVIEIYPLNCMPEDVAKTILPSVSGAYHKPVMSLVVDELSGGAGYLTRLEAFTQMIIRKKEAEHAGSVSGH